MVSGAPKHEQPESNARPEAKSPIVACLLSDEDDADRLDAVIAAEDDADEPFDDAASAIPLTTTSFEGVGCWCCCCCCASPPSPATVTQGAVVVVEVAPISAAFVVDDDDEATN